jgi:hypothetical protein
MYTKTTLGMLVASSLLVAMPAKAVLLGDDIQDWNLAGALTLQLTTAQPTGNQVQNLPCIICGANQPQQPTGFGYNLFGNTGNETTVSFFSTAVVPGGGGSGLAIDQFTGATGYSLLPGAPLVTALGSGLSFTIGIDVNDTNVRQTLESFWVLNLTDHTVIAVFSPNPLDGQLLIAANDGTGFPDMTLSLLGGSPLNLLGVDQNDKLMFFARITGANDGPDSFFIVPNVAAVPIPAVGTGIPGIIGGLALLMHWLKKRRNRRYNLAMGVA